MRWIFITHDESQMMDIKRYCKPIKWNCSEVMCIYASQRSESDGTETHAHSMSISTQEPEAAGCPQHWGDMRWRNLSTCRSAICTITIYIYLYIYIYNYLYLYLYLSISRVHQKRLGLFDEFRVWKSCASLVGALLSGKGRSCSSSSRHGLRS